MRHEIITSVQPRDPASGGFVDLCFLTLAALSLVVGVSLGVYMGMTKDHSLGAVHVHINLVGWASLALFGLFYRAYPRIARTRLAATHLAVSGAGGVLFPFGLYMFFAHGDPGYMGVPALLWLAGTVLFLAAVLRTALGGDTPRPAKR